MSTITGIPEVPVLDGVAEGLDVTDLIGIEDLNGVGSLEDLIAVTQELDQARFFAARDKHDIERVQGLFDKVTDGFSFYRIRARFLDEICGGIPNDPEIIAAWLRSKTGISDAEEIQRMMAKTIAETQGADFVNQPITHDNLDEVLGKIEDRKHMCVFKRDPEGQIYIENRQLKANIRESTNILFATVKAVQRFGATKKAPKSFVAERLFIQTRRIYLCDLIDGVMVPKKEVDMVKTFTGHVSGPQGDRSALTNYETCMQPWFEFILSVTNNPHTGEPDDDINEAQILRILEQAEKIGLGALRSQASGMFKILPIEDGGFAKLQRPRKLTSKDIAKTIPVVIEDF